MTTPGPDRSDDGRDPSSADRVLQPGGDRTLRQLPTLLHQAVRLVWEAAPRQLLISTSLQVVGGVALGVQLLVARHLLTRLLDGRSSTAFSAALPSVLVLVAVLAVSGMVAVLRTEMQRLLSELVARTAMRRVTTAASAADLVSFEDPAFHDRLQRSIVNASIRPLQMTTGLLTVGSSLLTSAAVGVTLALIEPLFLGLALLAVVPVTVVTLRVGRALFRFAVAQTPTDRERSYVQQLLTEKDSAKEIRAYGLGGYLQTRYDNLYAGRIAALRRLVRDRMAQGVAGSLLTAAISGGTLALLILFVSDGRTSLAGAGTAAAALILLGTQLQGLAGGVGQLYESALFVQDFREFTTTVPPGRFAGRADAPLEPGRIELSHVGFTYPSRPTPSLHDVSLTIEPGQVVALVGENGSGKTTLAKLLAGLYPVGAGTMTWDGIDVASFDVEQLRARVAVLFQDFVHYFFSARENVALGRWERASDAAGVRRAMEEARVDRVLDTLPNGWETFLGPQFFGGSDLSGGQWQRVALARAMFRDAGLVILDEPTAALDPRSEAALFTSVRTLFADRSVLLISHRFASVRMADRIYVLADGRVVEDGSHDELIAGRGLYEELFRLQAAPFRIGAGYSAPTTTVRHRPVKTPPSPSPATGWSEGAAVTFAEPEVGSMRHRLMIMCGAIALLVVASGAWFIADGTSSHHSVAAKAVVKPVAKPTPKPLPARTRRDHRTVVPSYRFAAVSPHGADTEINGINLAGAYTGEVIRAAGTRIFVDSGRSGAQPTYFTIPRADTVSVSAIDTAGEVVGSYTDRRGVFHGFLRDATGHLKTLNIHGAGRHRGEGTEIAGISPDGVVVGSFIGREKVATGFIDRHGQVTRVVEKGAGHLAHDGTAVEFYAADGEYGGVYIDSHQTAHGWYVVDGRRRSVDDPAAGKAETAAHGTQLVGVDAVGRLYGIASPETGPTQGFSYLDGVYSTIRVRPGGSSAGTLLLGVNASGVVVGFTTSSDGRTVGFIGRPVTSH